MRNVDAQAIGKVLFILGKHLLQVLDGLGRIRSCHLVHDTRHSFVPVYHVVKAVAQTTQFQVGHIAQVKDFTIRKSLNHDVFKLSRAGKTSLITNRVLERLLSTLTKLTRGSFDVLLSQCRRDVGRHQIILCHHIRLQPHTHRIVSTQCKRIADTIHTLDFRNQVNTSIVFQELNVVSVLLVIDGEHHQHRSLALLCRHTHLSYLSRQQTLCLGHTVLDIDLSHIRVCSLIKINSDTCRSVVGRRRLHVHHVFHTVYLVFQRRDYRVQHSLCIGTRISGTNRNGRWCNVRILGDRQSRQTNKTQNYQQDGDNR